MSRQLDNPIGDNFKKLCFFHGTDEHRDIPTLAAQGFRDDIIYQEDGYERFMREGNLGIGTYLTCNWETAVFFGHIILQATLSKGTRIIDTSIDADPKCIDYLKREFGKNIITSKQIHRVIPNNKKLTRKELVELTRYHYYRTWQKDWGRDQEGAPRWPRKRQRHGECLRSCVNLLKRYQFHGYGNPKDDNGILIFNSDRIVVKDVIAEVPFQEWWQLHNQLFGRENENRAVKVSIDVSCLDDLKRNYPSLLGKYFNS